MGALRAVFTVAIYVLCVPIVALLWWWACGALGIPAMVAIYEMKSSDKPAATQAESEERIVTLLIGLSVIGTLALVCWQRGMLGPTLTAFIHAVKAVQ